MRENYDAAFRIVIGLEGRPTNDPDDPGGFTIWGLSKKYNPSVGPDTTIDEAKNFYLAKYWGPAGCDKLPFPLDICVFDARVNPQDDPDLPGGSMQELFNLNPDNWQDFLFLRMCRYDKLSMPKYKAGHKNRILNLYRAIKALQHKVTP